MREVFVGLVDADAGWSRVLDQERIDHRLEDAASAPVVVLTGAMPGWLADFVDAGGIAVISGAVAGDPMLPPGFQATVTGFTAPGSADRSYAPSLVTMFDCDGLGELRLHEDRVVKYGVDADRFPVVFTVRHGRGALVASGIPLTWLLTAPGDRLRTFCNYSPVTERVASVDKAIVAETLLEMLRMAFELAEMPMVTVARFPGGAASVFILRVDVDGVYGENNRRLIGAAARLGLPASFFLNGDYSRLHPGPLEGWLDSMELGQHAWLHTLLPTRGDNRHNLERAEQWMRETLSATPRSFVAPRGLWNRGLGEALRDLGYRYSSDFGLDFNSLPFRSDGDVLQVPVHPYSPERATVWASEAGEAAPTVDDVRDHYLRAMREQVRHGRPAHVYGHPEVLGEMADDVLPALCALADDLQLPRSTLGDYADFWIRREELTPRVVIDASSTRLRVEVPGGGISIRLTSAGSFGLTVNGTDIGRVSSGRSSRCSVGLSGAQLGQVSIAVTGCCCPGVLDRPAAVVGHPPVDHDEG